jgi:hypothetical protein
VTPAQALLHQVTLDPAWPTLTPELREAIRQELVGVVPAHVTGWRTPVRVDEGARCGRPGCRQKWAAWVRDHGGVA